MTLHELIFDTDADAVKALVKSRPESVNQPSLSGVTPLIAAIEADDLSIVRILLDNGADVNACGAATCPPLHMAIDGAAEAFRNSPIGTDPPSLEIMQLLLDFGADIHALDSRNRDALTFAKEWYKPAYELLVRQASKT